VSQYGLIHFGQIDNGTGQFLQFVVFFNFGTTIFLAENQIFGWNHVNDFQLLAKKV